MIAMIVVLAVVALLLVWLSLSMAATEGAVGRVPIVGSSAVTRGLRMTAVDSAGRRKKVSTIVVEPAHVEGVDETETRNEEHADDAEKASDNDKDSKDKHD